jgi:ribosomal protein S11
VFICRRQASSLSFSKIWQNYSFDHLSKFNFENSFHTELIPKLVEKEKKSVSSLDLDLLSEVLSNKETKRKTSSFRSKKKRILSRNKKDYHKVIINSSLSNCIITIVDSQNNVIRSFSCGSIGFSKAKRSTYYAAVQTGVQAATYMKQQLKLRHYNILIRGFGYAKKAALKGFRQLIKFHKVVNNYMYDFSIPHNGCRPSKKKRR